ncbi:hypothetical protein M2326_001936 [Flavobacterium sp. 7A]|nr:hypothetical protein [Flavobacterium sp. 7A]
MLIFKNDIAVRYYFEIDKYKILTLIRLHTAHSMTAY